MDVPVKLVARGALEQQAILRSGGRPLEVQNCLWVAAHRKAISIRSVRPRTVVATVLARLGWRVAYQVGERHQLATGCWDRATMGGQDCPCQVCWVCGSLHSSGVCWACGILGPLVRLLPPLDLSVPSAAVNRTCRCIEAVAAGNSSAGVLSVRHPCCLALLWRSCQGRPWLPVRCLHKVPAQAPLGCRSAALKRNALGAIPLWLLHHLQ